MSPHVTDRRMGLEMYTIAVFPPTLNRRQRLVNLPQFFWVDWAQCKPSRYLIFLLHFPNVNLVFFLSASLNK